MISAELHDPTSVAEQQQQQQHQTNDNSKSGTAASSSSVSRNSSSVYLNPSAALSSESLLLRSPSRLTLKRRQESLHRNFSSISEDEIVLEEFVCAFNKSGLLIQGRLFVTPHHLAFLPLLSLLGSKIEINIKDIVDIHQSSVGGFIHNAITIQTQDRQRFFFQS